MSTYLAAELRQQLLVGRVKVLALNMNNEVILDARRNWVSVGWHPPDR